MKISSIGNLFASNIDAVSNPLQRGGQSESGSEAEKAGAESHRVDDAAVYSAAFTANRQSASAIDEARMARLQKVKEQVQSGKYQPDLDKVARAVLQELS